MFSSSSSESFCGPVSNRGMGDAASFIWSSVTSKIVLSWKSPPSSVREARNASSRLGPMLATVPASASVWHPPQFCEKSCLPAFVSAALESTARPAQPAVRSAAPASARGRSRRSVKRLGLRLSLLADALHGFGARLVDGEDLVQAGDLEDLRDVPVAADEREPAAVRAEALDPADEHSERGGIDEGRVREVDHDLLRALADHLEKLLLELGRRVEVDLAGQGDDVRVVREFLGLDVEVHLSPWVVPVGGDRGVDVVRALRRDAELEEDARVGRREEGEILVDLCRLAVGVLGLEV